MPGLSLIGWSCFLNRAVARDTRVPVFDPKKASGNLRGFYPVCTLPLLIAFVFARHRSWSLLLSKQKKVHFKDLGERRKVAINVWLKIQLLCIFFTNSKMKLYFKAISINLNIVSLFWRTAVHTHTFSFIFYFKTHSMNQARAQICWTQDEGHINLKSLCLNMSYFSMLLTEVYRNDKLKVKVRFMDWNWVQ